MNDRDKDARPFEAEAAGWLARCETGLSAGEAEEFGRWRSADPRHEAAVQRLEAVWSAFDRPSRLGREQTVLRKLEGLRRRDRKRRAYWGASLAAACGVLALIALQTRNFSPDSGLRQAGETRVIAPDLRTLDDGSTIALRDAARVEMQYSANRRTVDLVRGEALFTVAPDPRRPFIVRVGSLEIQAIGTAFVVARGADNLDVAVTEGRISVSKVGEANSGSAALPLAILDRNERLSVALSSTVSSAASPVTSAELNARLAWSTPRLEFTEARVAEAVRLFNAHNPSIILTADPDVAALTISGVFRSDNGDGFVEALEMSFGVRAQQQGDRTVRLSLGR